MKKDNLKILILIGIPASGKSTWGKEYVRRNSNWVRVNRDDFRIMLKNSQVCEPKLEDLITELSVTVIEKALMKRLNVIIDNTNVKLKYIKELVKKFKYSADIDFRVFDISLDKAIERDKNREMKVGEGVIRKMYENYKVVIDSFDFQPVNKEQYPELVLINEKIKNQAIIVDLDGTLSILSKRGPYDFDKVMNDKCNWIIKEQIDFHKKNGRFVIICSGRSDVCREETEMWLQHHKINFDLLLMRKDGDFRKDTIVKKEIYNNQILNRFNVISVFDDRPSVVDGWKDLGLFVFDVNQGLKNF